MSGALCRMISPPKFVALLRASIEFAGGDERSQLRTAAVILLFGITCAHSQETPLLTGQELSDFLGPVSPNVIRWTRIQSLDFELFNGEAISPLSGRVYFYLGGYPDFQREPNSTSVSGRLGIFRVKWYRSVDKDGSTVQHALVRLNSYSRVDIWVSGPKQSDVDQLIGIVSQLPLFNKKLSSPFGDSVTDELIDAHTSVYLSVLFFAPAVFVLGFWLLKRRLREVDPRLSRGLVWLIAYSLAFFLVLATGLTFFAYLPFSRTPVTSHAVWLTFLYGAVLAFLFCLIFPILAIIARCRDR